MAQYLIDGYNLLFSFLLQFQDDREELISYLSSFSQKMVLVFDAHLADAPWAHKKQMGSLKLVYTHQGENADTYITHFLKKKNASQWTVVSKDREVIIHSKLMGAQTISPQEFMALLQGEKKVKNPSFKPTKTPQSDLIRYRRVFNGLPEEHLEKSASAFKGFDDPELERLRKLFRQRLSEE